MTEPLTPDEAAAVERPAAARRGLSLPDDPNRRALTLGAIALAVLLFLFIASRVLLGGGGEDAPEDQAASPQPATTPTTAELAPSGDGEQPAESFEVFSTKNPFTPLINPPGTGGGRTPGGGTGTGTPSGGTIGGGTTGGGTTAGGGSGGTTQTTIRGSGGGTTQTTIRGSGSGSGSGGSGSGGSATTQPGSSGGGGSNEPRRQQRVALLDVLRRNGTLVAQVRVNDTVYTVGEGEVFADNYRVLSIDEPNECGRFIFGDEQFRLCRGEETLK